jgi:hypothetical protein
VKAGRWVVDYLALAGEARRGGRVDLVSAPGLRRGFDRWGAMGGVLIGSGPATWFTDLPRHNGSEEGSRLARRR